MDDNNFLWTMPDCTIDGFSNAAPTKIFKLKQINMKRTSMTALAIITTAIMMAFKTAETIVEKMGMQQEAAETAIMANLLNVRPRKANCSGDCDGGRMRLPYTKAALATVMGNKKAAALEMCQYIKSYCQSAAFNEAYQAERKRNEPSHEQPRTIDGAYMNEMKKSVAELEANAKKAGSQMEKDMYANLLPELRKQLKEAGDPMPLTTAWKEKYPETADSLVRKQLNFYLSELATVDFNAQLTTKYTGTKNELKIFANPKYETGKSKTWKYIFRAGKEVNAEVKIFVQNWLKEGAK